MKKAAAPPAAQAPFEVGAMAAPAAPPASPAPFFLEYNDKKKDPGAATPELEMVATSPAVFAPFAADAMASASPATASVDAGASPATAKWSESMRSPVARKPKPKRRRRLFSFPNRVRKEPKGSSAIKGSRASRAAAAAAAAANADYESTTEELWTPRKSKMSKASASVAARRAAAPVTRAATAPSVVPPISDATERVLDLTGLTGHVSWSEIAARVADGDALAAATETTNGDAETETTIGAAATKAKTVKKSAPTPSTTLSFGSFIGQRQMYTLSLGDTPAQPPAVHMHTLEWKNNSCATDAVIFALHAATRNIIAAFRGTATLAHVRDVVQKNFHNRHFGAVCEVGRFEAVGTIFERITRQAALDAGVGYEFVLKSKNSRCPVIKPCEGDINVGDRLVLDVTVWLQEEATLAAAIAKKLANVAINKCCGQFRREFGAPLVKRAGDADHWHLDVAQAMPDEADELRQARNHTCGNAQCSCTVALRDAHYCAASELCHGMCAFDVGLSVDNKQPYMYCNCAGVCAYAGSVVWYPALLYVEATLPQLPADERKRQGDKYNKRVSKTMIIGNACYDLKAIIECNGYHFRTRFETNVGSAWFLHDGTSQPPAKTGKTGKTKQPAKGTPVPVPAPQWITRQKEGEFHMCGYLFRRRTKYD